MKWPFQRHKGQARDEPRRVVRARDLRTFNRPRADRTIEGNEAIYAAVSRISNTMASMPIHFYKGYEIQKNHPLERLINLEPHPNFSAFSWKQTMEVLLNTEGTAYALRVLNSMGQLMRLDILNPTKVKPWKDEEGNIWYAVTMDDGQLAWAPGFLIVCVKHMSANGIQGIRPIDVLRKSLDYDTQVKELSLDQLDGVNHGVALTIPATGLGAVQKEEAIRQFLETYEKSGRSVVILEGGMTATNFSSSPVDSQLLDVERITRNRVATVYNLPPHLLGDYSAGRLYGHELQHGRTADAGISAADDRAEDPAMGGRAEPEADHPGGIRRRVSFPLRHGQPDPHGRQDHRGTEPDGHPRRLAQAERGARGAGPSAGSGGRPADEQPGSDPAADRGRASGNAPGRPSGQPGKRRGIRGLSDRPL